ncbi:MAG: mandelate racemase [Acuticoccus sp.]
MTLDTPRIRLAEATVRARPVRLRMPFGFGIATLREVEQAVISVRITDTAGASAIGVTAECLLPKWFDKTPGLSDADNVVQLRRALDIAIDLYRAAGMGTPFGIAAGVYRAQQAACAAEGLNPLVASYGPAMLDRAILDALGVLAGRSLSAMIAANLPGIDAALTPDLAGFDLGAFLASLSPDSTVGLRHTVGLVDALTVADKPADAPQDGLPVSLDEVIAAYGCRYFKLKIAGDPAHDLDRLRRIAAVLDTHCTDYRCTLDGNEQYDDEAGILDLWRRIAGEPGLERLAQSVLFIEQPIRRAVALQQEVSGLAAHRPVIVDESDSTVDAFAEAIGLGYRGVSSKSCKGFYKSILNAARVAERNAAGDGGMPFFLSGEDLMTLSGISTQQDLALVALLGLGHVERNGHHYVDGMGFAPAAEQDALVAAHPDLYAASPGHPARLRITDGAISVGSLDGPGYGLGAQRDALVRAWEPLPA